MTGKPEPHSSTTGTNPQAWDASIEEQQQIVWSMITSQHNNSNNHSTPICDWPSYDQVLSDLARADYTSTLTCPFDFRHNNNEGKTLCPLGAVCCVDVEMFASPGRSNNTTTTKNYTGIFTPDGTIHKGILRLSSAIRAPHQATTSRVAKALLQAAVGRKLRHAQLFPCAALKVFRCKQPSANVLLAGSKLGQRERDFFAHAVCTSMTEQMPRTIKPLVRKFWEYSDYPLSLGLSDACRNMSTNDDDDDIGAETVFPFAVVFVPCIHQDNLNESSSTNNNDDDALEDFLHYATSTIPIGTVLYDIYACPEPQDVADPTQLQRLGRIRTTSLVQRCASQTSHLFFRHQKKEDDYALRPEWRQALQKTVHMEDGTKGTVGTLAGWKLLEQQIAKGFYVDYEEE